MIPLYKKLKRENLLKNEGLLLDLGSGDGKMSSAFIQHGYKAVLVDIDQRLLAEATQKLTEYSENIQIVHSAIEEFEFTQNADGVIMAHVLPFISDKLTIKKLVSESFKKLNSGGFLFFSLFGTRDEWHLKKREGMSFYTKDEVEGIFDEDVYFMSEDYGIGKTRKGKKKIWHVYHMLYVK